MIKNDYNVIGVMSGTSMDGIDIAHCTFNYDGEWQFNILEAETVAYPSLWVEKLKDLVLLSHADLENIDKEYTVFLAAAIDRFITKHELQQLDAVCSHGHTALHQPDQGLTYQIGNLPNLAALVDQVVICDFRVGDVALGGQGAPLVPIGDQLLFAQYDYCLNLGGFANISTEVDAQRIAYDICPVNIVMNHYASKMGQDYDKDGLIAASGVLNLELLNELNSLDYYKNGFPKSLGLEWVRTIIMPLIDGFNLSIRDILRTFVEHVVVQIGKEIKEDSRSSVLITGGGAFNEFLMTRLAESTSSMIIIPNKQIVEYKEALLFAFLGVLKLRNENNCLSSVTGALRDHCSGKMYYP